jgi:hypothetical protein
VNKIRVELTLEEVEDVRQACQAREKFVRAAAHDANRAGDDPLADSLFHYAQRLRKIQDDLLLKQQIAARAQTQPHPWLQTPQN